jgi:dolichol-phosphate mannosyltransferase
MFRLAIDGITAFSDIPLKLVTVCGFLVSGITFLVMLYALWSKFISKDFVQGWTSTILCVLFIGGIQLIGIGIIGEYVSRIYKDVRNRPLYLIRRSNLPK